MILAVLLGLGLGAGLIWLLDGPFALSPDCYHHRDSGDGTCAWCGDPA